MAKKEPRDRNAQIRAQNPLDKLPAPTPQFRQRAWREFQRALDPLALPKPLRRRRHAAGGAADRKSTRLNSSHSQISYAVFCLKKKKKNATHSRPSSTATH